MLNLPTVLRKSAIITAEQTVAEFGKSDLSIVGGDNFSDYLYWNRSCGLPYKNWLDLKDKLVKNFEEDGLTGMLLGDTEPKYYEATVTPKVAQYLIIDTDKNGIDISYRNAGSLEGYTPGIKPKPYRIDYI